ncbi:MAG: hypothetical protein J7515_05000 [Caulobacter sp.]|nr:hypothetical protein [Caulobacter sp.]
MTKGKDPETADGLGGVHKVGVSREPVPPPSGVSEPVAVGHGVRPGAAGYVDDPDQVTRVVHTVETPIEPSSDANARESALRPTRTPQAPFQDARVDPDETSAWTAEKTRD